MPISRAPCGARKTATSAMGRNGAVLCREKPESPMSQLGQKNGSVCDLPPLSVFKPHKRTSLSLRREVRKVPILLQKSKNRTTLKNLAKVDLWTSLLLRRFSNATVRDRFLDETMWSLTLPGKNASTEN